MGDPRKNRKQSKGPIHPWNKTRIDAEKILTREFGLKNKQEIWKANAQLKRITSQAKKLIRDRKLEQAQKETNQLLERLNRLGLIEKETPIEDVLALEVTDILERRLQSIVLKNKLASTTKQARQMISHGHVFVNGKKVDVPSYLVDSSDKITYNTKSEFNSAEHAEIIKLKKKDEIKPVKIEVKEEEPQDVMAQAEKEIAKEIKEKKNE
jgi:small subunit ribosomal protein S4